MKLSRILFLSICSAIALLGAVVLIDISLNQKHRDASRALIRSQLEAAKNDSISIDSIEWLVELMSACDIDDMKNVDSVEILSAEDIPFQQKSIVDVEMVAGGCTAYARLHIRGDRVIEWEIQDNISPNMTKKRGSMK